MTNEHKGLPVAGYLPQTDEKVASVNINKELEERCLRRIEWFESENKRAEIEYYKQLGENQEFLVHLTNRPPLKHPYDGRWLARAKTLIQEGFMDLNRAVFQPSRVPLPEDNKSLDESKSNETTIEAMQDVRDGVSIKRFDSIEELMEDLHKDNKND